MTTFRETITVAGYTLALEIGYSWRPIIHASMSGPEEGGIEPDFFNVLSATDEEDQPITDARRLAAAEELVDSQTIYWLCEAHAAAVDAYSAERQWELRGEKEGVRYEH